MVLCSNCPKKLLQCGMPCVLGQHGTGDGSISYAQCSKDDMWNGQRTSGDRVTRRGSFGFFFPPRCAACGILVAWPGKKPAHPAVEAWSLNPLTAWDVPRGANFKLISGCHHASPQTHLK